MWTDSAWAITGDVNDVQVDTSAGFRPPIYSGPGSFPAPPHPHATPTLHENDECVPPGGSIQVTPDLTGNSDQYLASYTQVVDQPGHPSITKTVGPVPIPSMARSNDQYVTDVVKMAAIIGAGNKIRFGADVVAAWEYHRPPPSERDYVSPITPADYVPPAIPPPVKGGRAYADNIPEWNVTLGVNVAPGRWHQDYSPAQPARYERDAAGNLQLVSPAVPPRPLGTWRCDGFDMAWDGVPPSLADSSPAVPADLRITGRPLQVADSIWKHWRAGQIATLPSKDATTYVGIPTCAWIDDSGRPTQAVNLPSKSEVTGHALRGPVTITEYINVNVTPETMEWQFNEPSGHDSGFETGRGARPASIPRYDPNSQTWPSPQSSCPVFHQYSTVRDQVTITATQWYDFTITGYFNNGTGRTELIPVRYRLQARWDTSPLHVFQIEAVPFVP